MNLGNPSIYQKCNITKRRNVSSVSLQSLKSCFIFPLWDVRMQPTAVVADLADAGFPLKDTKNLKSNVNKIKGILENLIYLQSHRSLSLCSPCRDLAGSPTWLWHAGYLALAWDPCALHHWQRYPVLCPFSQRSGRSCSCHGTPCHLLCLLFPAQWNKKGFTIL